MNQKIEMMKIITVYDKFVQYIEPITDTIPRRYSRLRDAFLDVMWRVPEQLYTAAMSNQVSHVHKADAMLATLRWFMRRMTQRKPNLPSKESPPLTIHQQEVAEIKLAETGGMIHQWLENVELTRKGRATRRA